MHTTALLIGYCVAIAIASLAGGRLTGLIRVTHLRAQLLMSGVGGLMLGIAMLHLLPHATEILNSPAKAGAGSLAGLTFMFLLVRLFHSHDHGPSPEEIQCVSHPVNADECDQAAKESTDREAPLCVSDGHSHRGLSWVGLFFGLLLHTVVDGIALASSVIAERDHGAWLGLAGIGTFLAVALHKPLDAFAITSVMSRQHWSSRAQWMASVLFSLACPLGAFAFYVGVSTAIHEATVLGWGLAISAGFFIGIALADLLPEVAFHDHDRGKLTTAFLLGIAVAVAIESLPGHNHGAHDHRHEPNSRNVEPERPHRHLHEHDGHPNEGSSHSDHDH